MSRLRVVGPDERPGGSTRVEPRPRPGVTTPDVAPHPPTVCIQCGAPARVTVDNKQPSGVHRTYLVCANKHGMAVHWGEEA